MERKSLVAEIKGLDEQGRGEARIATLQVRDADGDVLVPGLLGGAEQVVPLVPAHQWHDAPLGKTRVREQGRELIAAFQLNMKLSGARDWRTALQFDLDTPPPRQQWSFAFRVPEGGAERGMFEGQPVRFLKRLQLLEVSPVLVGASVNTATLSLKAEQDLAARTAEVVAEYERMKVRQAVEEFERIRERDQGQHGYKYVKLWSCDQPYATAWSAAKHAARELGVKMPEIKVFAPCEFKDADFTNATKIAGYAHAGGWEIGVAANLTDERDISWIAAHEVKHLSGGSEAEAVAFAEAFTAKVFGTVSRSPGSWSWDAAILHARALRQLGVRM